MSIDQARGKGFAQEFRDSDRSRVGKSCGCPSTYEAFKKLLRRFEGARIRVAYEAGPAGFELYDRLTRDGTECIVTPPSLIPTESGNKVKTDKIDSYKLVRLLEGKLLKRV